MNSLLTHYRLHCITIFAFVLLSAWWVVVQMPEFSEVDRQLFSAIYGLMALWGAVWGIKNSIAWGGMKSLFGKALVLFSLGLFAQEFGQLAYSYYANILHIEIPYPSLGDLGYFGSIPLYIWGAWYLAQTAGIRFTVKSLWDKVLVFLLPVGLLAGSYFLFLRSYEFDFTNPLVIFLDFGYPLGQALYISVAIVTYVLCRKMLGGVMRPRIMLLLVAFLLQYVADFTFLYQNILGTWEGGRINDYMYLVSYTVMTFALIEFGAVIRSVRQQK